ncbi:MAG TPA: HAMP domain-containing sensor histidine kinase [Usitatibacter sp.]|nr:HAMP domain-containing sensor histidine kinase [Usitatibacter sp.]
MDCQDRPAQAAGAAQSRDDILAIVSHDLRNPLNLIAMSARALEDCASEEARKAQLGIIHRAVARMSRLIGDLLDVSQIAQGTLRVQPAPLEVSALCGEAKLMFTTLLASKGQAFECPQAIDALSVLADRDRMLQVLSNLVGNAHKFTPEGGRVALRVEADGAFARFAIVDSGPGLAANELPQLFDRFWQAGRERRGGVGLGLPIAKGIVEAHGGRIWAESSPGLGTSFYFTIPQAR